ncbi:DUF4440 domain-containing protein [Candidatus Saccharibacteria bacterium]|nr:DUF4440 domain-containing protein [Calditrichia bacterium]NIW00431.1 DUF4440 domain-containing protein [Candidatus Saccharibacteria bacterium]
MSTPLKNNPQQEIWQIVQELNVTWVEGNPGKLDRFFHPDMVIVSPDFQQRIEGRDACVQSYKDFSTQATIHNFKELDAAVEVFGDTAIVSYAFQISYEMNGKRFVDTGRDIFVFVRRGNQWLAVWRTLLHTSSQKVSE